MEISKLFMHRLRNVKLSVAASADDNNDDDDVDDDDIVGGDYQCQSCQTSHAPPPTEECCIKWGVTMSRYNY